MVAFLNDRVLDLGLTVLDTEATHLHICSAQPADFAAVAGVSLGSAAVSIGAPVDGTPTGRAVTVAAIDDAAVSANGTASHYAIVDTPNSRLLAANTLSASQVVTSGNNFDLASFTVRIPDPA